MAKLRSYIFILFWVSLSMISGLFLFTNGFFLRRSVITDRSNYSTNQINFLSTKKGSDSFDEYSLKAHARVILLIVDALKYEFVAEFDDAVSTTSYHRNKMPIINKTLKQYQKNSNLLKFIADPPTTTMQRLKSITTGTLPTFIDLHDNFASPAIVEDNFIDQNLANGNIFMGDDTWTKLYPNKFLRKYDAPSFDVSDLDTVDLQVKKSIFDEIKKPDWSLLAAHILGIDHCGHKHGMHHPEMSRKLNETNYFIEELIKAINENKEDTILFVVGDHGMTESGDHGGESSDEIEAAMFVYSTQPLIDTSISFDIEKKSVVNQIDIVPTISIILGNPIPFSNIGQLIIESLPSKITVDNFDYILQSLWRNIFQVQYYVDVYSSHNFLSDETQLQELKDLYNQLLRKFKFVKSNSDFKEYVQLSNKYFTTVRRICYEIWVQFDPNLMTRGLILFFCANFSFFIIISGLIGKRMVLVLESSFLTCILSIFLISLSTCLLLHWINIIEDFKNTSLFICGLIPIFCFAILLIQNWDFVSMTWFEESQRPKTLISIFTRLILLTIVFGVFSNSYILEENKILSFFLITLFCFLIYTLNIKNISENVDKKGKGLGKLNNKIIRISMSLLLVFIICFLIRSSNFFWRSRHDQKQQNTNERQNYINFIIGKAGSIVSKDTEIIFVFFSIASLAIYITVVKIWLRDCGNLSGYSPSEILARFIPGIIVVTTSCYWILKLQRNSKLNPALLQRINSLPHIIYALFFNAIVLMFYKPLAVYLLPKEKESISYYQEESLVPKLYGKLKNILYKKKSDNDNEIPIVFGLGTVYSAFFVLLSVFLCLIYTLLLGFVIAPSVIFMNILCITLLYVSAMDRIYSSNNLEELLHVPNPPIVCWFLIAEYFFYATGHQPTFQTIHWDAGFIGVDGSLQVNFLRALLIGINTFGSHIILGMTFPLLVIAPFTLRLIFPNHAKTPKIPLEDTKGELSLFQNNVKFHSEIFAVAGKYILFHANRVFICMLATTVHCRHLMVWEIFAPKLIFEGISFIITTGSVLISLLLLLRIDNRIDKLISQIM